MCVERQPGDLRGGPEHRTVRRAWRLRLDLYYVIKDSEVIHMLDERRVDSLPMALILSS